jgi:hypothetical protein
VTVAAATPIANVQGEQVSAEPIAFTGPQTSARTALLALVLLLTGIGLLASVKANAGTGRRNH